MSKSVRVEDAHCVECGAEAVGLWYVIDGKDVLYRFPLDVDADDFRNFTSGTPCEVCGGRVVAYVLVTTP